MSSESGAPALCGSDKRYLRKLAHPLPVVVQIGGSGLTKGLLDATDRALEDHELVKLRIGAARDERRALAESVAARTGSTLAGLVGHVVILYRPARDPERRRIALPSVGR